MWLRGRLTILSPPSRICSRNKSVIPECRDSLSVSMELLQVVKTTESFYSLRFYSVWGTDYPPSWAGDLAFRSTFASESETFLAVLQAGQ